MLTTRPTSPRPYFLYTCTLDRTGLLRTSNCPNWAGHRSDPAPFPITDIYGANGEQSVNNAGDSLQELINHSFLQGLCECDFHALGYLFRYREIGYENLVQKTIDGIRMDADFQFDLRPSDFARLGLPTPIQLESLASRATKAAS